MINTLKNTEYEILTSNGFKNFNGIKKISRNDNLKIHFKNKFIIVTPEHKFYNNGKFIAAQDLKVNDFINNDKIIKIEKNVKCSNEFYDLINVENGHHYTANNIEVSNCAFLDPKGWNEFVDGVMPSQSGLAHKKNILLSTANGKNHFYDIWNLAGNNLNESKNNYIKYKVDWQNVPRYKSGGIKYTNEDFREETIKKYGIKYWRQNYECEFIGSSDTLIPGEILNNYKIKEPIDIDKIRDLKILIYEEPQKAHKYVIGVDTAKEGADFTAFQIFDFTNLEFNQVASAHLKIDYALLPEILNEYGLKYNTALIIIENNEGSGQVVADILKRDYEYENLYYDFNQKTNKRLKYPGFRTTKLSRDIMLQTVVMLALNNKITLCDEQTIKEFETFVMNDKGKYEAIYGSHDDLVMATCLCFGIFNATKNFEDYKVVVDMILSKDSNINNTNNDILTFGAFSDGI